MSQAQPTQPNQPQYQISVLELFPLYATRAAYQQATGQQAPPFDVTQPIKGWTDATPNGQPYTVFDPNAAATGYTSQIGLNAASAARLNLPGTYTYPAYVAPPTDAVQVGPYGPIGSASPDQICMQTDAQEIAREIGPLYPGQVLSVVQENTGVFHYLYGLDPRRQWVIVIGAGTGVASFVAQTLIEAKNSHGVGAPGHWVLAPAGSASPGPNWVYDAPATNAPANAVTVATPIRPLLPNEQIVHLPGSLFNQTGSWVVERTDLTQPQAAETEDQQFADVKSTLAAIRSTLGTIQTKLGA